jgi:D-3-phosphoglycerate dehydrogenase
MGDFGIEVAVSGRATVEKGGQSLLVTKNTDVPGVIGQLGTALGEADVNISRFYLGRQEKGGEALAVIEIDSTLEDTTLEKLRGIEPVILVKPVKL